MSITVKTEVVLDDDFVSDVLITAFDGQYGGARYWNCDRHYVIDEGENGRWNSIDCLLSERSDSPALDAMYYFEDEPTARLVIDAKCIEVGLNHIVSGQYKVRDDLQRYIERAVRESDAGDIDADAADVIVQVGLFGRLIYG